MIDKSIGERIRTRRRELGMLQTELAEKVGFKSGTSVTQIENGDRSLRQDKIKPMAKALDVSVAYILGTDDDGTLENENNDPLSGLSEEKKSIITDIVNEMADLDQEELSEIKKQISFILFKRNN